MYVLYSLDVPMEAMIYVSTFLIPGNNYNPEASLYSYNTHPPTHSPMQLVMFLHSYYTPTRFSSYQQCSSAERVSALKPAVGKAIILRYNIIRLDYTPTPCECEVCVRAFYSLHPCLCTYSD